MTMIMHRDGRGRRALEAVFADLHPSRFPLRPDSPTGTLLFGLGNALSEGELDALNLPAQGVGESSCYLVFLESFPEYPNFPTSSLVSSSTGRPIMA